MKAVSPNLILICLAFLTGTGLSGYLNLDFRTLIWVTAASFAVMLVFFRRAQKLFLPDFLFISGALVFVFFCGSLNAQLRNPGNDVRHYKHFRTSQNQFVRLKLTEDLSRSEYNHRFYGEVLRIGNDEANGRVLVNLKTADSSIDFSKGQVVLTKSKIQKVAPPKNPYQFDYSSYLKSKGIEGQIRTPNTRVQRLEKSELKDWQDTAKLRKSIAVALKNAGFSPAQVKLIQALLLGQKDDLNPETYQSFTQAGLVHVLAVSGLHVGILLMIFSYILYPLRRLPRGDLIQTSISVVLLWLYAALVGLTPSVIRAVTMFSLLGVGVGLGRKASTLNMLALSAVILVFYNPDFIAQVGFQLSYAAVLSIVLFKPKIDQFWTPQNAVIRFFWTIISVSFCAQIGILPISLYYFHQFAGLFLISNILIIPVLGILLGGGILAILLSVLGWMPAFFVKLYGICLDYLRVFVDFIAGQGSFVIENIVFSKPMLIASLLTVFGMAAALYLKKKWIWAVAILALFSFQGLYIWQHYCLNQRKKFVVFHQMKHSVIGKLNERHWQMHADLSRDSVEQFYWAASLQKDSGAAITEVDSLQQIYEFDGKTIWCPTEDWRELDRKRLSPDFILLHDSPGINLERFLKTFHPQKVIADGSNYYTSIARWKNTCQNLTVEFQATKDDGAFVLTTTEPDIRALLKQFK